ncbi:MAG: gliding motility-associated C-terminal domain-containing protein [Elusimicrobia bacterium]|nr:gliding motility-associated C-terminal domain-containing protein [Elusimicrobiota bacterium]
MRRYLIIAVLLFNAGFCFADLEPIDSAGNVGEYASMAVDSSGNFHVSYWDQSNGALKYAKRTGAIWSSPVTIDPSGVGGYTSIAVDGNNHVHISYYDTLQSDLNYAYYNGTSWSYSTVVSDNNIGRWTSICVDTYNYVHISYYSDARHSLNYIRQTPGGGGSWDAAEEVHYVAGSDIYIGEQNSIAVDLSTNVHISYRYESGTDTDLYYAEYISSEATWKKKAIDTAGKTGCSTSIALDSSGHPHISYYRIIDNISIKHAYHDGTSWNIETVNNQDGGDYGTKIFIDPSDYVHISYYNSYSTYKDLMYANNTSGSWNIAEVTTLGDVGKYSSVAIVSGQPYLCYRDDTNTALRFAYNLDTTPPNKITDLVILTGIGGLNPDELVLEWTAPGDDGATGTADHYYIKYTTNAALDMKGDWNQAETYTTNLSVAGPVGTPETLTCILAGGNTYYIAIRAYDDFGSWTQSNTSTGPAKPDHVSPSAVTDLAADKTGTVEGQIHLSWTAPGDNGTTGTINNGSFRIEYSSETPVSIVWSSDTSKGSGHYSNVATSGDSPGTAVSHMVTGLTAQTTYYFRVWYFDEVPNASALSSGATDWAQVDVTVPGTITDLAATVSVAVGTGNIKLDWSAPGDDQYSGTASTYTIRFATFNITSVSAFNKGDAPPSEPSAPAVSGTDETFTITGLDDDTVYYVAIRTCDELRNWSNLSNVPSAKTLDVQAPSAIDDLSGLPGTDEGTITLSWTAPGDNGTSGTASYYVIKATTTSPFVWGSITSSDNIWGNISVGGPYGTPETYILTGLTNGATYYIEIHSFDERPNEQTLCNTATSFAQIDSIAPATTLDLDAVPGDNIVTLSWTAPGDNNTSGYFVNGGSYTVRYSTISSITNANWDSKNVKSVTELVPPPSLPLPLTPLASESVVISGLTNYIKYWFALRTNDEENHRSGVSNSPSAIPTEDMTAPTAELTSVPPDIIYVLGNKIVVKAKARDAGGIRSITLYYRKTGKTAYSAVNMYTAPPYPAVTKECSGEIPASKITKDGIDYYVEVLDKSRNWWFSTRQSGAYPCTITPSPHKIKYKKDYEVTVGSSKQTVTLPDGNPDDGSTSVKFPEGALKEDTPVVISQEDPDDAGRLGDIKPAAYYIFQPDGTLFREAVTLTLLYFDLDDDGKVDGTKVDEEELKILHWDGFEWRLIGGEVDTEENTVSAKVLHFSDYALFPYTAEFALEDSAPLRKIITPNEDGVNDYAEFSGLEPPYTISIYNIRGRLVRKIEEVSSPIWDGKDDDGDTVESGVYIYQIDQDGELISGVIAVGK